MSLPKYNELYLPFLTVIQDGAVYSTREIKAKLASIFAFQKMISHFCFLTVCNPSGRQGSVGQIHT